jgi:hypothetical protein
MHIVVMGIFDEGSAVGFSVLLLRQKNSERGR